MKADFDIGNLVYVILTIAFLIIGAIGKKKKPVVRVSDDAQDAEVNPDSIKSQLQVLFNEFNPTTELLKEPEYKFSSESSVEEGPALDVVPEADYESVEEIIPAYKTPLDNPFSNYEQAKSSLDTTGMDEGIPAFDYEKDDNSLVYNKKTKEYSAVLSEDEEVLAGIIDDFDPKAAFVYSEIFNRKEF
jgi:hypothetical protein